MFHHEPLRLNVLTQNALLDKTLTSKGRILPQDDRIESIAATLNAFDGSLDVVGIQEAHVNKQQHNGKRLAELCGLEPGVWHNHNQRQDNPTRGRADEYIGMIGGMIQHVETIDLGDNRAALLTEIAGVAFVTYHLRAGASEWARGARIDQATVLVDAVSDYENVVGFGDDNEVNLLGSTGARDIFGANDFVSAYTLIGQKPVKTYPTAQYRYIRKRPKTKLDDILIKGDRVRVLSAGVLKQVIVETQNAVTFPSRVPRAGSDHEGLCAKLEIQMP